VAILAVLVFHAGVPHLAGGFVGVDVFFVISGFLITQQLLRPLLEGRPLSLGDFYARRARRILPAAGVVLLAVLALGWLILSPLRQVDLAGVWSGAEHDKFEELGLTARPASQVAAPLIEECPINIECVVRHQLALGAHDLYIAEIVATQYDEDLLDARGRLKTAKLDAMAYVDGEYWALGKRLGIHGGAAKAAKAAKAQKQ